MITIYGQALGARAEGSDQYAALRSSQIQWVNTATLNCSTVSCLLGLFEQRIAQLKTMVPANGEGSANQSSPENSTGQGGEDKSTSTPQNLGGASETPNENPSNNATQGAGEQSQPTDNGSGTSAPAPTEQAAPPPPVAAPPPHAQPTQSSNQAQPSPNQLSVILGWLMATLYFFALATVFLIALVALVTITSTVHWIVASIRGVSSGSANLASQVVAETKEIRQPEAPLPDSTAQGVSLVRAEAATKTETAQKGTRATPVRVDSETTKTQQANLGSSFAGVTANEGSTNAETQSLVPDEAGSTPWAVPALVAVNVIVYIVMAIKFGTLGFSADQGFSAGANYGPSIHDGEYWRLFTSNYIHFGFKHILSNMLVLLVWGIPVEERIGSVRFVIFYSICGLIGSVVSVWIHPSIVSAGASGAIAGVAGMLLMLRLRGDRSINGGSIAINLALNALLPVFVGGIDWAAHVGGFVSGIALLLLVGNRVTRAADILGGVNIQAAGTKIAQVVSPAAKQGLHKLNIGVDRLSEQIAATKVARDNNIDAKKARLLVFVAAGLVILGLFVLPGKSTHSSDLQVTVESEDVCPNNNQETCPGVVITSHAQNPITITRLVMNNRVGVKGCDVSTSKTLNTGDSTNYSLRSNSMEAAGALIGALSGQKDAGSQLYNCGDRLVRVDIETDQGSASYTFKEGDTSSSTESNESTQSQTQSKSDTPTSCPTVTPDEDNSVTDLHYVGNGSWSFTIKSSGSSGVETIDPNTIGGTGFTVQWGSCE